MRILIESLMHSEAFSSMFEITHSWQTMVILIMS